MVNRAVVNAIRQEIEKIKDDYNYSNLGHAFVHFAIKLLFDLEDEEAADYCSIGIIGHDHGIDAIFEKDDVLYIAQGKYAHRIKKFKRQELTDLQSAITFLSSPPENIRRKELLRAIYLYQKYKDNSKEIRLLLLTFGDLAKSGKEYIHSFEEQLPPGHTFKLWTLEKLADTFIQTSGIYSGRGPDINIRVKDIMIREESGLPRSIICTVPGSEISRIVNLHRRDIFQLNVREFLVKTQVNKEIEKTINSEDPHERRLFWYYNLGISAICERFSIDGNTVKAENFKIVNGCQTATLLAENSDKASEIAVLMRIIETSDAELANKITLRNNTQNPIRGRDLFSQHSRQVDIQNYFNRRSPPIFYERRAGEWRSLPLHIKLRFRDRETRKYRVINNYEGGKAFLAFKLKKPAEAKMKKKLIFVSKENGGFYEDIFDETLNPEELLLSLFIYEQVKDKIKGFIRGYDSLSENDKKKLEIRRAFLPHADTQLTAMFSKVLDIKYPNGYDPRRIYESLKNNPSILGKIYEKLVGILEILIKQEKRLEGEAFNPRNYLVSADTYGIIEDSLKLQSDAIKPILEML